MWLNFTNGNGTLLKKGRYYKSFEFKAAESIRRSLIDTFGVSDTLATILNLQANIALLKAKMYDTKNLTLQTKISIKELELKELIKGAENEKYLQNYMDSIQLIRKEIGVNVDYKLISIFDYYSTLKTLENGRK